MNLSQRILAQIVDFFLVSIVSIVVAIPILVITPFTGNKTTLSHFDIDDISGIIYSLAVIVNLFLLKDAYNGKSIGKRLYNLQIISKQTERVASPLQCYIRNLSLIIWPVELVILVFFNWRIGDVMAGTKVINVHKVNIEQGSLKTKVQIVLLFIISQFMLLILSQPIKQFIHKTPKDSTLYWPQSYNQLKSNEISIVLYEKMNLRTEVRVYDKAKIDNKKYVTALIYLNRRYYNPMLLSSFEEQVIDLVRSIISASELTGQLKFIYKDEFLAIRNL